MLSMLFIELMKVTDPMKLSLKRISMEFIKEAIIQNCLSLDRIIKSYMMITV